MVLVLHDLKFVDHALLKEGRSHHHDLADVDVLLASIESGVIFRMAITVVGVLVEQRVQT